MGPLKREDLVPVESYLASEATSTVKHEYLGGRIYAMAGGSNAHNRIASNVLGSLHAQLRGRRCEVFNSDTKIRIRLPSHVRFYYPDVSVVCRSNPPGDSFQDEPGALFEVLSPDTRRTDEGEKMDFYLTISSLTVYVLLEQDRIAAVAYRRSNTGFVRETYEGREAIIAVPAIGADLRLSDAYERVDLVTPPGEAVPGHRIG
jgi:Uma2 family endonuclease